MMVPNLSGKIALVTGASRGIGYAVALGLAQAGAHVVALARTVGGLEDLDDAIHQATGANATLVPCDLTDYDALDRLGAALFERYGKLDILVGNAAILGSLTPVAHIKPKEFERVFSVNVTANYRLLRSMDLLLRSAPQARAIFMTDKIAHEHKPYWGAYAASKVALETLVKTYAAENAHTSLRVELLQPDATNTHLRRAAFPGDEESPKPRTDLLYPLFELLVA